MRIEGKKNGRCSNGTIRRTNHKNIEAIGKGGVEKIEAKGLKGLLKKNFHHNIGGKKEKYMHKDLFIETHEDIGQ